MRKKPMACGATATHLLLRPFHLLLLPFIHPLLFESYSHFTTIPTAPTRMMKARTRRVFLLARPIAFYWTSLYRVFFKKISFWRLLEGCRLFSIFFRRKSPTLSSNSQLSESFPGASRSYQYWKRVDKHSNGKSLAILDNTKKYSDSKNNRSERNRRKDRPTDRRTTWRLCRGPRT